MLSTLSTRRSSRPVSGPASLFRREVDDLFGRFFGEPWGDRDARVMRDWWAPLSIWDDEQNIYIDVELPGVSRDDVELVVQQGSLRLRGERKPPNEERDYWYSDRAFGQFERTIALSEMVDPDNIDAQMHDGILSVKLLKRPESQRKKIPIKAE